MGERVDAKNIKPTNIGEGLWVKIRKKIEHDRFHHTTKNLIKKVYWTLVKEFRYEECYELFANYGKGGAVLTTSQMAYYCFYLGGVGEYLVEATQKGFQGKISIMRFNCFEDGWIMYPKMSDKILESEKFKKEYADEYKELKELKEEIQQIKKGKIEGDVENILEQIRDILEIIDSGKVFYEEEFAEKQKVKRNPNGKGGGGGQSKSGVKPFMREIFPRWQKHVYHQPNQHEIFPAHGKIVEKDGVIYEKEEEQVEESEMRKILGNMKEEPTERRSDLDNLVNDLSNEDYDSQDDNWLGKSFR